MEDQLSHLKDQYFDASDSVSEAIRGLQATHFIFHSYVDLICGEDLEQKERVKATDIFLYALENMERHMTELEGTCERLRTLHWSLMADEADSI